MSDKNLLRKTRQGIIVNVTSKKQETGVIKALNRVVMEVSKKFRIKLRHETKWFLKDIVEELKKHFADVEFHYFFDRSNIQPDGGVLFLEDSKGNLYPILIAEVKNQGTNVSRQKEGLPWQAKGNAIERLGKNVIGLRTALLKESIFPFVCFGYGCDFADNSSILDRVVTVAMFGKLNKTYLYNDGEGGRFNRGSFYFREKEWTVEEMFQIMKDITTRSIQYYFSKYGEAVFTEKKQNL